MVCRNLRWVVLLLNLAYGLSQICVYPVKQEGLIPPKLPLNYYTRFEHYDNDSKVTLPGNIDVLHDIDSNTIGIAMYKGEQKATYISDFNVGQTIALIRHGSVESLESLGYGYICEARDLLSEYKGQSTVMQYIKVMKDDILFYDGPFRYIGDENIRGINCNKFSGCYNRESKYKNTSMQIIYAFSESNYISPSGMLHVPLQMHALGSVSKYGFGGPDTTEMKKLGHSFYYFDQIKPEYKKMLQIPDGVYCDGLKNRKPFPIIQREALVTGVEVSTLRFTYQMGTPTAIPGLSYQEEIIWANEGLESLDFTPKGNTFMDGAYADEAIRIVYSMHDDVSFLIKKSTSECKYFDHNILFEHGIHKYRLADNVIFKSLNNSKYLYKGEEKCGEAMCEVWITEQNTVLDSTTMISTKIWTEISFFTKEWKKYTDVGLESEIPVEATTYFQSENGLKYQKDRTTLRLFNYEDRVPTYDDFKLSTCLIADNANYFIVSFNASFTTRELLDDEKQRMKFSFIDAAAKAGEAEPFRFQNIEVHHNLFAKTVEISFSIMSDPAKSIAKRTPVFMVWLNIQVVVDSYDFMISLQTHESRVPIIHAVPAIPNSAIKLKLSNKKSAQSDSYIANAPRRLPDPTTPHTPTTEKSTVQKGGYGTGPLVACILVMLLFGMIMGAAAMIFYFKKFYNCENFKKFDDEKTFAMDEM